MFLDELSPIFKELIQEPMAFLGGFCSAVLRLNLSDDRQTGSTAYSPTTTGSDNGKTNGPQSISIE